MISQQGNNHHLAGHSDVAVQQASDNKVLRDTYRLLSATLIFSAIVAALSASLGWPSPGLMFTLIGYFGLLYATHKFRNSGLGLIAVFALTGFMGYTMGPILNLYLSLSNGPELVATAIGVTGLVFVGLSSYARSENAVDTSKMGGFLLAGILVAFGLGLAAVIFELSVLSLAVSGMFVLLMAGLIMYETQNIIRGGETNYILATVTLFVAIYNLFSSLLHIFGFLAGED